ncbi:hypothetical protein TrLO_g13335 [Triparma laevis f. longispina]|uniref:Fucose-specific lectin n=1 Tax=Triparma laevis f. longispina TaxID=1714387 RepID=A0A9W7FHT5_9STRA|nr:hypothetical protein TrLO_g13335 [Triparma laevis f. longispina]
MRSTTLFCLLVPLTHATTTEMVALPAAGGGAPPGPNLKATASKLDWAQITYDEGTVTSAYNVTLTSGTPSYTIYADAFALAGRWNDGKLYGLTNQGVAPEDGGCCADSFTVYSEDEPEGEVVDLSFVNDLFPDALEGYAWPTHTFDIVDDYMYLMVQYKDATLNAKADAIVVLELGTYEVVQTASGSDYFSFYEELSTLKTTSSESVFNIQHYSSSSSDTEEWHGNGVTAFTMKDGTDILAITHRSFNEAILMTNPYTSKTGGEIVQRFGKPGLYNAAGKSSSQHDFGGIGATEGDWNGMHNVYYSISPSDGSETITVFVNSDGGSSSVVYNFDINLRYESDVSSIDDTAFDTEWRSVSLPFQTGSQGGARPIGPQKDGSRVFVVASGGASKGIYVVSEDGEYENYGDGEGTYDPFVFYTE